MLSRPKHELNTIVIQVTPLLPQPPPGVALNRPTDDKRLLAKHLPPGCSLKELKTFLSRAGAVKILRWRICVKPTNALLQFASAPGGSAYASFFTHPHWDTPPHWSEQPSLTVEHPIIQTSPSQFQLNSLTPKTPLTKSSV